MEDFFINFGETDILILIAMLPCFIIGFIVYRKDVIEKEPVLLLLKLFLFGALSTGVAIFCEIYLQKLLPISTQNNYFSYFFKSFMIIGLCEEGIKWIFTYVITWREKNFNYTYDAIVYAVFVSLGFASVENIMVILFNGNNLVVALLRGLITVPAHAFFAILSGYYLGIAKKSLLRGWKKNYKKCLFLSVLLPILMHGLFDFLLLVDNKISLVLVVIFIMYLYFSSFFKVINASKKSKKITENN